MNKVGAGQQVRLALMIVLGLLVIPIAADAAGGETREAPASIDVSGLGWWDDRQMKLALERLLGEARGPTMAANAIEDSLFLLMAALSDEGFQRPVVIAKVTLQDGRRLDFEFDHELLTVLPRPMKATAVELAVTEGVRYTLDEIKVTGGEAAIESDKARDFFGFGGGFLIGSGDQLYSRQKVNASAGRLEDELRRRGYADAMVEAEVTRIDHETGEVSVAVAVMPGPRWQITKIVPPTAVPEGVELPILTVNENDTWDANWQQDKAQAIRQSFFAAGYPDLQVKVSPVLRELSGDVQPVQVTIDVVPGDRVIIGAIQFTGDKRTKQGVLNRRVAPKTGDPLDPGKIDEARYRLSRLGIFRRVDVDYTPKSGAVRDVIFKMEESPRREASLLLGYGSYEQVRGGFELSQTNLWGAAHHSRLQFVQSMRGYSGNYTYIVPELLGEQVDGSVRLFSLQREEVAFQREEYGGTITFRRPVGLLGADGSLGYTYESLRSDFNELSTKAVDEEHTKVASLDFGLTRDQRDNALRPTQGYRWFGQAELASKKLGGEVDYQRLKAGISYHTSWGRGRWIHAGLVHGVVLTLGSENDQSLPVNKRFYPGGESSIRGYQEGEATPRAKDGSYIGAKSYMQLNLELEQALTKSWSAILFLDALGATTSLAHYPFDERLFSAGIGVRYQTLIGPVRLEYGRNLNPRSLDPAGTLHFSVGFPF